MEIKLPDYRKIAAGVEKRKVSVEEREIDNALKWLQQSRAKFTLRNQPAQKGDFVEIEYWIEQLGNSPLKDAFILGQGYFLLGFEENLVGMGAGEEKENIALEKDGKKIKVKVKIKSVQNVELPEIGDDFAKDLPCTIFQKMAQGSGKFENLNELKKNIREELILEKEQAESQRLRNEILEKISEETECEIPGVLVEQEKKQMLENFQNWVKENLKISFEEYLNKIKKTEKEILDFFSVQSQKKVKNLLILREIGKKELDPRELKEYTTEEARIEKVFQLLEDFAKI